MGTAVPVSPLHVIGSTTQTNATFGTPGAGSFDILGLTISNYGYVNLGSNLFFNGSWNLRNTANDGWLTTMNNAPTAGSGSAWSIYHVANGVNPVPLTQFFTILPSGNVGIGTTSPQYKLAVNGTVSTKEVIVTTTGWADYVFTPGYRLPPLGEVSAYIKVHHHLPDIPSQNEVGEKGVNLGEMQAKLLAKIEELTLHMIQADERNNRLEQQNSRLQRESCELQERIVRLEERVVPSE